MKILEIPKDDWIQSLIKLFLSSPKLNDIFDSKKFDISSNSITLRNPLCMTKITIKCIKFNFYSIFISVCIFNEQKINCVKLKSYVSYSLKMLITVFDQEIFFFTLYKIFEWTDCILNSYLQKDYWKYLRTILIFCKLKYLKLTDQLEFSHALPLMLIWVLMAKWYLQ